MTPNGTEAAGIASPQEAARPDGAVPAGHTAPCGLEAAVVALLRAIDSPRGDPGCRGIRAISLIAAHLCRIDGRTLRSLLRSVELAVILETLREVNGRQRDASRILGLKFTTLNNKLRKYGIRIEKRVRLSAPDMCRRPDRL